jgi:aspartyl-tRNA synthetase
LYWAVIRRCISTGDTSSRRDASIGEIIGGSQREERLELLDGRMRTMGLEPAHYGWYRDLRRYGSVPHAGFGLGFERLIVYLCGLQNIRDAILYPRVPGSAQFGPGRPARLVSQENNERCSCEERRG